MYEEHEEQTPGQLLLSLRVKLALKPKRLAELLGVNEKTVRLWEKDQSLPTPSNLERFRQIVAKDDRIAEKNIAIEFRLLEQSIKKKRKLLSRRPASLQSENPTPSLTETSSEHQPTHEETRSTGLAGEGDKPQSLLQADQQEIDPHPSPDKANTVPENLFTLSASHFRYAYFTGRNDFLAQIHTRFAAADQGEVTLPLAITGPGGMGKTQVATEYIWRYHHEYPLILWMQADTLAILASEFERIANKHGLIQETSDQRQIVDNVKQWLCELPRWLLVLDNVEDPEMLREFLPLKEGHHILATGRNPEMGTLAHSLDLPPMPPAEAALFLLRRAKRIELNMDLDDASQEDHTAALELSHVLGGLPLALEQAGSYIEGTPHTPASYLRLFQTHHKQLLQEHSKWSYEYPDTVATTWAISFKKVRHANPAAGELLYFFAFLDPDEITPAMIWYGRSGFGLRLRLAFSNPVKVDRALRELRRFSLIQYNPATRDGDTVISMHRLIQVVLRDGMSEQVQYRWVTRVIHAVYRAFMNDKIYLAQARNCATLITQWRVVSKEAADLLLQAGHHARLQQLYRSAEAFLSQALAIHEQVFGPESVHSVNCMTTLAMLYQSQERFAQAESTFQRAREIVSKAFGPNSFPALVCLNNLANLALIQEKFAQAEQLYWQVLNSYIQQKMVDVDTAKNAFHNLVVATYKQQKYAEAEQLLRKRLVVLQIQRPESVDTGSTEKFLAAVCVHQGKYAEAESLVQHALAIFERSFGGDREPVIAVCFQMLAEISAHQKQYEQADSLYQRAIAIMEEPDLADSAEMYDILTSYGSFLTAMHRTEEAARYAERANTLLEELSSRSASVTRLATFLHEH